VEITFIDIALYVIDSFQARSFTLLNIKNSAIVTFNPLGSKVFWGP